MMQLSATDVNGKKYDVSGENIDWQPSVYAIVIEGGKILLSRQHGGRYCLPGGGMKLDESFEETVVRETKEETGIDIVAERFVTAKENLFIWKPDDSDKRGVYHSLLFYYVCKNVGGSITMDNLEGDELEYAELAEWVDLEMLDKVGIAHSVDFRDIVRGVL